MQRYTPRVVSGALGILIFMVGLAGCGPKTSTDKGGKPMTIQITSSAFGEDERIPDKFTVEGEDISPPLEWSNLPEGTKELALICDDPDAPTPQPWVHWVIYKIPADAKGLTEGIPRQARLKNDGMLQGQNSWSTPSKSSIGYRGPMPPPGSGNHQYRFTLYALSGHLVVQPGISETQLLTEMEDHILGSGQLIGLYSR